MQISSEIRWFFTYEEEVGLIKNWMTSLLYNPHFPSNDKFDRQDYYLSLPGSDNLSVKLREPKIDKVTGKLSGKIEVKVFVKNLGEYLAENGFPGLMNQWAKFSFDLLPGENNLANIVNSFVEKENQLPGYKDYWLQVNKNRLLLMYDVQTKKIAVPGEFVNEGCGIELTIIKVNNQLFYSLGLEAFSGIGKDTANLLDGLHFISKNIKGLSLNNANPASYPEFLKKIRNPTI
ncbi:hypothetical protein BH11BAC3_BH11BAC3_09060 [soil metagenome]